MATLIYLKKMTWTMEEGLITKWLKREGDTVSEGEGICQIETEKTTDEIQAPTSGILLKILRKEGTTVPVNAVIAAIGSAGEDVSSILGLHKATSPTPRPFPVEKVQQPHLTPEAPEPSPERARISPSARRLARERGVDISRIRGTGPSGRIVSEDILKASAQPEAGTSTEEYEPTLLAGHRKVIADRLSLSARTAVHVPITMEVDMTSASELKAEKVSLALSYTDFIVKASALALGEFPAVNTMLLGQELRKMSEVNVGVAVGSGDDLLVPVIRNADRLSLAEISKSGRNLIERARGHTLTTKEMSGGTFTVSNLGMYDVDLFAPVINPPEAAILGVGRIAPKVVVLAENMTVRQVMTLTLVFDHRVIDGVLAARFLQRVKQLLEDPEKLAV